LVFLIESGYVASIAYHLFGAHARSNHQRRQAIVVVHANVHFAVVSVPCGIERWPQCAIVLVVVIATSAFTAAVRPVRAAVASVVATVVVMTMTVTAVMVVMALTVGM
jgi:hypothetical protein